MLDRPEGLRGNVSDTLSCGKLRAFGLRARGPLRPNPLQRPQPGLRRSIQAHVAGGYTEGPVRIPLTRCQVIKGKDTRVCGLR